MTTLLAVLLVWWGAWFYGSGWVIIAYPVQFAHWVEQPQTDPRTTVLLGVIGCIAGLFFLWLAKALVY